ncbi:MAG: hypothetical protein V4568_06095 [Pseudomonadota bacterium]
MSFPAAPVSDIALTVDDIVAPSISLTNIAVTLSLDGKTAITIGKSNVFGQSFKNAVVTCAALDFSNGMIHCPRGKLVAGETSTDLGFTYVTATKRLDLSITPSPQEHWQITGRFGTTEWQTEVIVAEGQLARFASLIPTSYPRPSKGSVTGRLSVSGRGGQVFRVVGDLRVSNVVFSDTPGLHAADKLAGSLRLTADRAGTALSWHTTLTWGSGEIFWAPLYFSSGGHSLEAHGKWDDDFLQVDKGTIQLANVGEGRFSAKWSFKGGLSALNADATNLNTSGLYTLLLKPFLEKTAFDQLAVSGKLNAAVVYANKAMQRLDIALSDITLADAQGRFGVEKLNATIPWRADAETQADIRFGAAKLLGIPFGAFQVPVKMHAFDFTVDELTVPMLDGKLLVKDLRATQEKENWRWQFSGVLLPVSMEAITKAMDAPIMRGVLSATIPRVSYANGTMRLDGGIGIRIFDGDVAITQLSLAEPLGRAPRLSADVQMRNLDLGMLTSTFKFGSIEGRIDADVQNLELSNWKPVTFNARVESSEGNYRKKISQQAVQNISALGGAGAAAAIQRSFLRFFEEFGYQKIGLACKLRNSVCEMSGVESTPQGYIIVKGGGIPAITVKGYNRNVGWDELLARLARITQGNVQPVIQ